MMFVGRDLGMSNKIIFVCLFTTAVCVSFVKEENESEIRDVVVDRPQNWLKAENSIQSKQIPILPPNPVNSAAETAASYSPCSCKDDVCSCCSKFFSSKNCMKFRFIPDEFLFEFRIMLNGTQLMKRKYQGKNPAPSCVNLLGISAVKMCADFSNVHFRGRNMHICLDTYVKYNKNKYFSRKFDCMVMGEDGVKVLRRPIDQNIAEVITVGPTTEESVDQSSAEPDTEDEDYDEVEEDEEDDEDDEEE